MVVGTHGGSNLQRMSLGSRAEEVFRDVNCPVLTVGPRVFRSPEAKIRLRHIACAIDCSPESEEVVAYAVSLAEECDADLTLLHVVPGNYDEGRKLHAGHYCEELRRRIPDEAVARCRPHVVLEHGSAASTITGFAAEKSVDLIVMGAKNHHGNEPMNGTACRVVCEADCPVITISTPAVQYVPSCSDSTLLGDGSYTV